MTSGWGMMRIVGHIFLLFGGLLLLASGPVVAAPPASCAQKFVGTWTVRVNVTGQTYPLIVRPNGTSHITCPLCPSEGTWTCNGDTFTSIETSTSATLSADGRTLTGGCCTTTRVGAAVAAAPASGATVQPIAATPKSVSCDTVQKSMPRFKDCDDADFSLQAARATREKYPRVAADQFQKAAAAARRAGDTKLELAILREATSASPNEAKK